MEKEYFRRVTNNVRFINANGHFRCVYCFNTFVASEIKDFADAGKTLICPFCSVDAVIHSSQYNSEAELQAYHNFAFRVK